MTDTDRMVAWLREAMDAAQADAEAAPGEPLRATDTGFGPVVLVGDGDFDGKWSREGQGVEAAYRCDDPYDDCADARHSYLAEARLIAAHASRAAVLRRIAADRKQLAEHAPTAADFDGTRRCLACGGYNMHPGWGAVGYRTVWPCPTIRNLAEGWGWTEEEQR